MYVVTGAYKIAQCADYRQRGPNCRFVQIMSIALLCRCLDRFVKGIVDAEGLFVWRQDMNTPFKSAVVAPGDSFACGTVDDCRMREVFGIDMALESIQIEVLAIVSQLVAPGR